jgi:hypothetical protein
LIQRIVAQSGKFADIGGLLATQSMFDFKSLSNFQTFGKRFLSCKSAAEGMARTTVDPYNHLSVALLALPDTRIISINVPRTHLQVCSYHYGLGPEANQQLTEHQWWFNSYIVYIMKDYASSTPVSMTPMNSLL